jgi:hypothetical protein
MIQGPAIFTHILVPMPAFSIPLPHAQNKTNTTMVYSDADFDKAWADHDCLRKLMEAHGPSLHSLTAEEVCSEDLYFLSYKKLTLLASIKNIKNGTLFKESNAEEDKLH